MLWMIRLALSLCLVMQFNLSTLPPYVEATIRQVERWRDLVEWHHDKYFPEVPIDLTLAIIAQESKGLPEIISQDNWKSVGLMQVIPRSWVATTEELKDPTLNISWGMWFYQQALIQTEGSYYLALKIYNCGPEKLKTNPQCGDYYAEQVMTTWLPHFVTSVYPDVWGTGHPITFTQTLRGVRSGRHYLHFRRN